MVQTKKRGYAKCKGIRSQLASKLSGPPAPLAPPVPPKARRPDTPRPKAKQVPALSRWSHDKLSHMADRFAKLTEDADKLFGDLDVADALRYSDPRNYQKAVEARKALAVLITARKRHRLDTMGKV